MRYAHLAVLVLSSAVLSGACGRKPRPLTPSPQPRTEGPATPAAVSPGGADRARADADARMAAERARSALAARIHFGFDRSDLTVEARSVLDAKLPVLRSNPGVSLMIEGHADERGSDEYNLALGMRRADAASRYLAGFGIEPRRLQTATMGESEPLDGGHDEGAWAQNRRAEFHTRGEVVARQP